MKNIVIGIVDYGFGNIPSLYSCLMQLGFRVNISAKKSVLKKSDILFLPGVGSFDGVMSNLKNKNYIKYINEYIKQNIPILGICIGFQILFEKSTEGKLNGLGIFKGEFKSLKNLITFTT